MLISGVGINADSVALDGDLDTLERTLAFYEEVGFDYVELPLHGLDLIMAGEINAGNLAAVKKLLSKHRFKYTAHAPDYLNLMDIWSKVSHAEVFEACLEIAAEIGARVLVYHAGRVEPRKLKAIGASYEELLRQEIGILKGLAERAGKLGIKICIENGMGLKGETDLSYGIRARDLVRVVEEIGRPSIGITYDFGHGFLTASCNGWDLLGEVREVLPFLQHIHVHDNFGIMESKENRKYIDRLPFGLGDLHLPPGYGRIPYSSIFPLLSDYRGVFMLEINPRYWTSLKVVLRKVQDLLAREG
ncbi:sugar phosphate isomerase/epimerase family protein [Thermanaeromonas sp. C210]|uniref:sugar phosphate isomerase/epimerase family protein n=1 Tax=Thermanaeromonas sp. C210 TaxID=2731925 RepID=UPI00155C112F|nr:sugar phosphate isomerase/epimerase family protein [Thermanaeromonas sp. C210]GFN24240.1 xylose isomerase [Thermanaeromonas sp. C210]